MIARQYHSQDGYGQAKFGYSHPGQSSITQRDAKGNKIGSYAYIDPDGKEIRVNFIADENGYRVDNNFIGETAEVSAARQAHMDAHAAALAAARAASPNQEEWETPVPVKKTTYVPPQPAYVAPQPQYVAPQPKAYVPQAATWVSPAPETLSYIPQPVQDTPEVLAAKAQFFQAYNEAAARAPAVVEEEIVAPVQKTAPPPAAVWAPQPVSSWTPVQVSYGIPQQVQDTPDVLAAKAQFYQAYNEAALRAAQNP